MTQTSIGKIMLENGRIWNGQQGLSDLL